VVANDMIRANDYDPW